MYGDRVGKFQLFQLFKRIVRAASVLKLHFRSFRELIYGFQYSGVSVENSHAFFHRDTVSAPHFPFQLIIVPHLHDLIPFPEKALPVFLFFFGWIRRIQVSLQDLVQSLHAQKALAHGSQNLDIERFRLHISREFVLDQRDHYPDNDIRVISLQEKEIAAFIIQRHLLASVDLMGVYNDIALRRLAENLLQLHNGKHSAADDIPEDIPGSYAGKLILISHKDQPGTGRHCQKQRMHQMDIYHGHFINDDHIRFQRIL